MSFLPKLICKFIITSVTIPIGLPKMENYDVHMENCAKMNFKMSRRLTLPNIKTSELE